MRNPEIGGAQTYGSYGGAVAGRSINDRRARRAERQVLFSNIAIASAFIFVTAIVFGLL